MPNNVLNLALAAAVGLAVYITYRLMSGKSINDTEQGRKEEQENAEAARKAAEEAAKREAEKNKGDKNIPGVTTQAEYEAYVMYKREGPQRTANTSIRCASMDDETIWVYTQKPDGSRGTCYKQCTNGYTYDWLDDAERETLNNEYNIKCVANIEGTMNLGRGSIYYLPPWLAKVLQTENPSNDDKVTALVRKRYRHIVPWKQDVVFPEHQDLSRDYGAFYTCEGQGVTGAYRMSQEEVEDKNMAFIRCIKTVKGQDNLVKLQGNQVWTSVGSSKWAISTSPMQGMMMPRYYYPPTVPFIDCSDIDKPKQSPYVGRPVDKK